MLRSQLSKAGSQKNDLISVTKTKIIKDKNIASEKFKNRVFSITHKTRITF